MMLRVRFSNMDTQLCAYTVHVIMHTIGRHTNNLKSVLNHFSCMRQKMDQGVISTLILLL